MLVEAANPAHSLADSPRFREALAALDTVVVIDTALTETARCAHYVLPAATQFEKAEATFFNFEFPRNAFQLRRRLFAPPPGALPEAEIHARLVEALGAVTEADLQPLREAAKEGREAYAGALMTATLGDPRLAAMAPVLAYRTMALPDDAREGAVVLGLALKLAMQSPDSLARAGFAGGPLDAAGALFDAILQGPSAVVFAQDRWEDVLGRLGTPDGKVHLALPDLLEAMRAMLAEPDVRDAEFPFVLSAGERRSFTANTIVRDPAWRKADAAGALRLCAADAATLGVVTGDRVRVTTRRGTAIATAAVTDAMQPGHASLPNGLGVAYEGDVVGVAPNELTRAEDRDPFVGTPWHKHVPARLEKA
jgi:formate dehydrogenase